MRLRILLVFLFSILLSGASAQNRLIPYEEYIAEYSDIALQQQKRHGIPASITLAQGILESGAGKSDFAIESNNHFGIKCHNNWNGKTMTYFDDGVNSCFRKYNKASESYEDHSEFLVQGSRYRFLFQLDISDYKGWANGLQKSGYATDRSYADKLIRIIETYDLNNLTERGDKKSVNREEKQKKEKRRARRERKVNVKNVKEQDENSITEPVFTEDVIRNARDYHGMENQSDGSTINPLSTHIVQYVGTTPCIIAKYGDSFASIAEEFGLNARGIIKNNDFPERYILIPGELVYLDKKTTWWEGENPTHIVIKGETMLMISQKYGLQLKALYKLNDMKVNEEIHAGQRIKLRNPEQMSEFVRAMNESLIKADTTKTTK